MTKLSGFILVDKLSTVFQFILINLQQCVSRGFINSIYAPTHVVYPRMELDGTSSISFSTLIFFLVFK